MTDEKKSLSVSQVNRAIGAALEDQFSDAFWVVGEVQGYDRDASKASQRRWGQIYFELIEKEAGSDTVKAGIKALVWGDVHNAMKAKLLDVAGDLKFQDGLQVRLLCKIDFYWPRANLQLKVLDVDPHFTLGDMERARRELIESLKRTGLFDRNRETPLSMVPLDIGLITSDGSAAYHDFVEELRSSGYAFRLHFVDARMQGADTENDVPRALVLLAKNPEVEVIVLIRGGGSRSDLIWFDKEKVARAVAVCPIPVVTGIGHEIDLSVADLVAHTSRKTPTAVAQFLIERARAFETVLSDASRSLREAAQERLDRESRALSEAAKTWRESAGHSVSLFQKTLSTSTEFLRASARRHLGLLAERLKVAPARLEGGARGILRSNTERLESFRKECEFKDPRRILARGYSLIYVGGRIAKSVRSVQVGEFIEARLSDGLVTANVLATKKD
ncbi:MAG: exodeoxyribonuclease VII large subunit [Elusimicrobia bacterium]|nr:exodeoxyribonuclease VII large subunit [Elusimicrobiota bacterium]